MKKRFYLIIIATIFIFGCGERTTISKIMRFAYIAKLPKESFHDGIANGIKKEASRLGVHVDIFPAKNQQDVKTQKDKLQDIQINKNYDGVILAPNNSQELVENVRALNDVGIPFIIIDTPLTGLSELLSKNCGFVGTDNIKAGRLAARFIESNFERGNILLVRGNHGHRSSTDREKGFISEIQKNNFFHVLTKISGQWETEATFKTFSNYIKSSNNRIDAIFAYSDPMAIGVAKYYEENRIRNRPIIVGVDGVMLGQQAILEGKIDATIVQAPEVMGELALKNLNKCITESHYGNEVILTPVTLLKASRTLEVINP